MAASGSFMMASNMGFKINKIFFNSGTTSPPAGKFLNWVSLPYNNPYPNPRSLCDAMGFPSGGITNLNISVAKLNPATGTFVDGSGETGFTFACNATGPGCAAGQTCNPMATNAGLLIRNNKVGQPPSGSAIFVGSSNETQPFPTIYGADAACGNSAKFDNYISIPYHTTAVKASDLCTAFGMTTLLSGSVIRVNGDPAAASPTTTCACSTTVCTAANNFNLVIGEAILVRKNTPNASGQGNGNAGPNICVGGTNPCTDCTGNPAACLGGGTCSTAKRDLSGVLPTHF
jgi:hypothetical protein